MKRAMQINVNYTNNYLLWHYIHSLLILKIEKYFFSTLVCFYLFLGGGVGTTASFFPLPVLIAYHMHTKHVRTICMPKSIS